MPEELLVSAKIEKPFRFADVDVKVLKKQLRKQANVVNKQAKRLVSKKGLSEPDAFPGRQSGTMRKSIKTVVWKSGFGATVKPVIKGKEFYPAFVVYGHRGPKTRTAEDNRKRRKIVGGKVAAPRANFMAEAIQRIGSSNIQAAMTGAFEASIKPVGIL